MFSTVPLTFLYDLGPNVESFRPYILHCFAECGAKHLVLTNTLMAEILKNMNMMAKLKGEMAEAGLSFVDAHALFGAAYDLRTVDAATVQHVILLDKLQINICAEMGIQTITMHPGGDALNPEIPFEKQMDNVIRTLEAILPEAEACGVTVCIENSWARLSCPNNLLRIKAHFPTDALGFCYDSGHANVLSSNAKQYEESAAKDRWTVPYGLEPEWEDRAIDKMLPHIVNCHLHDNNAQRDQHKLPGEGSVDWEHVIDGLRKAPRLQCIQCEVKTISNNISIPTLCRTFDELLK